MWHLGIAKTPDLAGVYRESLVLTHPPFFVLLFHFWAGIAKTTEQLRWFPIAFGVASLWAGYRWVKALLGDAAALCAVALLAFLPPLILLSTEIRGYSMLFCFLAASLDQLERGLAAQSVPRLAASGAFALLALLSHYGAVFVLAAAFLYAVLRLRSARASRSVLGAWIASQAALAGAAAALYVFHISGLRGGRSEIEARTDWLKESFFRPESENALVFLVRQTLRLFEFVFATRVTALAALALVVVAFAALARRRRWPALCLLVTPIALTAVAGLAAVYPYGGSRHDSALALFACAGVGFAVALVTRERLWAGLLLAAALLPAAFAVGS